MFPTLQKVPQTALINGYFWLIHALLGLVTHVLSESHKATHCMHPKDNAHVEALNKLGLDDVWTKPLDPAFMLDISTWTVENQAPLEIKDLPNAFLQRLWLLSPDARNSSCNPQQEASTEDMNNGAAESQYAINPLDLVTAVYMSANTFLQQEITLHMVKCQFAVPLVLPNIDPEEPGRFLLWPLRGVVSHWRSDFINRQIHLASANMPMISFVKLGLCGVSKSQVLNNVIRSSNDTFLHRGLDGGELPRRLSNGLVEIAWYLPTGDAATNIFPVPVVISNLRGNAGTHEKYFSLLCQVSSAVVVFCGNLKEEDKKLLISCKNKASNLILINVSNPEKNENRVVGFVDQNLEEGLGLPGGSILQGGALSEEELASRLCDTLKDLFPDNVKLVTLEAVAELAEELGLIVDEAVTCKKSMAKVDEVLNGLDEGSTKEPLSQQEKNCTSTHDPSATEQQFYVTSNGSLSTQGKQLDEQELTPPKSDSTSSLKQIMSLDHSFEHQTCSQPFEHDPSLLSLEHFLREMGLIFELTHISPGSGSQNVLRLPSLATELLLYGVPIELMDGDASNIPIHWLGCVFAELKRRLPQEQCRIRVLTNLGVHHARNAEVLSALFGVRFPEIRSTKGIYMLILCLPENLKKDMECDFLLLIDVEGLCLDKERNMPIHDNEMATVATGLSDILMQNISPHMGAEFETHLSVIVSALLRIKECGSMPICQFLTQDDGLNSVLQASQLKHVSAMLQNETSHTNDPCALGPISINFVKGPWHNISLSEPVDMQYSKEVLRLNPIIDRFIKKNVQRLKRKLSGKANLIICSKKGDLVDLDHTSCNLFRVNKSRLQPMRDMNKCLSSKSAHP
uniref:VLIG-type G domain-containing protein n=1 Tax=Mola mola TaxID=94237 RepID=A0A3Q4BBU2_MOLML